MNRNTRRRLAFVYRAVYSLAALVTLVLQVLHETGIREYDPSQQAALVIIAGGLAFLDNVRSAYIRYHGREREEAALRVHKAVAGVVATISESRGLPIRKLGACAFVLKRRGWPRLRRRGWRVWISRDRVLIPAMPFRMTDRQTSGVRWTEGKGVVGRAWKYKRFECQDLRGAAKKYSGVDIPAEKFKRIPAQTTRGLDLDEFMSVVDKYAEVAAVPINSSAGEVLGCLSVDVRFEDEQQALVLTKRAVEEVMDGAASLLRDDLKALYV